MPKWQRRHLEAVRTVAQDEQHESGLDWSRDGYEEWVTRQGLPVVSGLAVDLENVKTEQWSRLGVPAAFVHLDARGDFCNLIVTDLPPGVGTEPVRHLYEELVYVLDGRGTTVVSFDNETERSFEWSRGSVFAIPLNARYRHYNGSGTKAARLASVTNLPATMKLFRDEEFIFDTHHDFIDRIGPERYYGTDGTFTAIREHRNIWDTNVVRSLYDFDRMTLSNVRGAGSLNIMFMLGNGSLHAHMSEIPAGFYKKAHRHEEGYHIFQLSGEGYSLYWKEDESKQRVNWKYGLVHSPPRGVWHQHFNLEAQPARYLAMGFGSIRWPFLAEKMASWRQVDRSADQIEYADEDPAVRETFELERATLERA